MTDIGTAVRAAIYDKLDSDDRQPLFSLDVASWLGGPADSSVLTFGVLVPKPAFWLHVLALVLLEVGVVCIVAIINYKLIIRWRGTASAYLVGFAVVFPICLSLPYVIITTFGIRNMVIKFALATIMPVLTIFHTMETMFDTTPPGVESSLGQYMLYLASPLEVCYEEKTHCALRVTKGETQESLLEFGLMVPVVGLYQSILGPLGYEPFVTKVPLGSIDHSVLDLFSLGHLGNNLMQTLLLQLYLTAFSLGLKAATNIAVGVRTKHIMDNPLLGSRSPSDFWGKKWNTLIHGVLKRAIFKPVRRKFPRWVAAFAAFAASGFFHEWILRATFFVPDQCADEYELCQESGFQPAYGKNIVFFLLNAMTISLEDVFGGMYLFQWVGKNLPRPVISLLVVSTALPYTHLFTTDYINHILDDGKFGFPLILMA